MRHALPLRLVDDVAPEPPSLFATSEVRLTAEKLITPRGEFEVEDIRGAFAQQRVPRVWPYVATIIATAAVGLPVTASFVARQGGSDVTALLLACFAGALFFGIYRLLTFEATYCVVVECSRGQRVALKTHDHQLVIALVAAIHEEVAARRPSAT